MSNYGKYKFKQTLKKYWIAFVGTGLFACAGAVFMLVGFQMSGWSIIDWLKSPYAVTALILFIGGALVLTWIIITVKRHNLGD